MLLYTIDKLLTVMKINL